MSDLDNAASVKLTTANLTDIYTVPALTTARLVGGVTVASLDGDPCTVTVKRYQASDASTHTLATLTLAAGDSQTVAVDMTLDAGDKIRAQANRANAADVTVAGEESDASADADTYADDVPAVAQGADDENPVAEIATAGTVTAVTYTPKALITGADTDSRNLQLVNETQAGVVVAELDLTAGHDAAAFAAKAIPLSGTPARLVVAAGDVLTWKSTHVGAGIADPGGQVAVTVTPS